MSDTALLSVFVVYFSQNYYEIDKTVYINVVTYHAILWHTFHYQTNR